MDEKGFSKQQTILDIKSIKEDVLPEKIGPYVIEALIARSSHSIIYLGYHPEDRQVVALKVLSPDYVEKKAMVSSFINEGSIIQMASHPNIVKLYAEGKWEGGLYLAMEFIRGVSLRQFIQQHSLSLKRCLDIVLQVCYALCHLHAHGIIHGDLKPENILIGEDGEVKVLDFGIAKIHSNASHKMKLAGTPSYMSPEHKTSVHNLTFSSDIYSLGVIAYELITGKLSFGVIHLDKVPKTLRPIIEKCLKKSTKERYSDVVDLIYDLSEFFKQELSAEKLSDVSSLSFEIDFMQNLQEALPSPKVYLDPLDFGFARNHLAKTFHPLVAHVFDDSSLLIGLFQGHKNHLKNSFDENRVLGFIEFYLHMMASKNFVFEDFIKSINAHCFRSHLHMNFSFIHVNQYLDEMKLCHGGFLAPEIFKNKKISPLSIAGQNPLFGSSLDDLRISSHQFDIKDQIIMHSLTNQDLVSQLENHFQAIQSYSSQILAETLIKKFPSLELSSIICMQKVK